MRSSRENKLKEAWKDDRGSNLENIYIIDNNGEKEILKKKFLFDKFTHFTNFLNIVEEFVKEQPIYYDKSKIFWIWNHLEYKWEKIDETDLMNAIDYYTAIPSTNSQIKAELLESFKRIGRKKAPKQPKKTWIQFKNKIVDIQTNEVIDATPKYFITNPIPHKLGESTETPTIDELLREWVTKEDYQDESYSKTLKEIIAYCFLADMPIHRIFCFIGEGLNGKGTFLRLIENFVGESNKCASEIEVLVNNRFESSRLYKKLICIFGEIDKGIFNKTKTLKSLSGDDLIRFEFKGKDGFDDHNYAKPLISANHLPETTDKSKGFYRRWTIVNFPNQFNEKKNVLENIPEEEYENFCLQSIEILQNLLKKGEFTNDGSIEERENKYEKFSNNINEFIKIFCDIGSEEDYIEFSDFSDKYNDYLNSQSIKKKSKIEIGRSLELRGYFKKVKRIGTDLGNITTKMCIQNLKWKQEVKDLI